MHRRSGVMPRHRNQPIIQTMFGCLFCSIFSALPLCAQIVAVSGSGGQVVYTNLPSEPAAESSSSSGLLGMVQRAAGRFQVDPKLVDAAIRVESQYNPRAISSKGAMGLMQLMPATAERFGVQNPFDPGQNIEGGTDYLGYLLNLFKGNVPLSLAAYNAGENAVLRDGDSIPDIPETRNYVRKVTALYGRGRSKIASGRTAPAHQDEPIYRYSSQNGVALFTNDGGY